MSQTLSNIIDNISKIFAETKREQTYFRIRKSPGDFYYYTFMGAIFSRHPLRVYEDDFVNIDGYSGLTRQERRAVIYQAIRQFLIDNGQADIVERLVKENKLDVIIQ